jgi:hypothetical protein
MMNATLSKVLINCSGLQQFSCSSGICCDRHRSGPSAQSRESRSTDKLPETAIWPSCSLSLSPIIVRLSPNSFKWAATSIGLIPLTLYPASLPLGLGGEILDVS